MNAIRIEAERVRSHAGALALSSVALALSIFAACGASAPAAPAAPTISFANLGQIQEELARHKGRGVLLNFWATWCGPCVHELPDLLATAHAFREQGGDLVLVSYDGMVPKLKHDEVRKTVADFATARGLDVPILIYDAVDYDAINEHFELSGGIPATIAYDRSGKEVDRNDDSADRVRFDGMMKRALRD